MTFRSSTTGPFCSQMLDCSSVSRSSVDLDDDFPPLSRAGLPDGMVEKKPRRRAKKSLHPDAQSDSLARGDSVNLKGSCLAEGCDGDKEVQLVLPAGPQAGPSDGESQEADQDSSRAGADDLALFQFFTHEVCQHQRCQLEGTTGKIYHISHVFTNILLSNSEIRVHR